MTQPGTDYEHPIDPEADWQRDHIRRYVATDGADGHLWQGVPTLLLLTKGRRSGKVYRHALIYGQDGDRYVVVASKGGHPRHPGWYRNLVEDPRVRVQVGDRRFEAVARTATAAERPALWRLMTSIWPAYDEYQQRTSREIPVVVLDQADRSTDAAATAGH